MSKWVQAHMYASSTWFKSSTGEISAHETTFYSLKDLSKTKRVTTRARSVSIVQKHPGRVKHELKWHMRNDAYKPIKRLGAVSFSIASILHIHLSIHILQYECVRLIYIYIRHTSSLKLFVDARVEVPRKKHHKTKTSQKLQTSNDMDSLCKNDWLTLIHFSLRRSGDSNLTFLTGCEMSGMTQEITHGCTSKVWSALTLRFPFSASAAFFHNWLELFERDGTLAFASRKRSQKFQPC